MRLPASKNEERIMEMEANKQGIQEEHSPQAPESKDSKKCKAQEITIFLTA